MGKGWKWGVICVCVVLLMCVNFSAEFSAASANSNEENLNQVVQAFLQAKNGCYMDGTDMMRYQPEEAYGIFRNRMISILAEENYSTVFYCYRQAYVNEIYRLRNQEITDYQYSGWIKTSKQVNGKYQLYIEEVLTYLDAARGEETGIHQYFTIIVDPQTWKIERILSGDVFYRGYYNEKDGIGLEDKFNKLFKQLRDDFYNKKVEIGLLQASVYLPENTVLYDGAKAAEYAQKYWYSYNKAFPSYAGSGGDCANYGSQAVSAGLGNSMLNYGRQNALSWYHGRESVDTGKNWTWTSTSRFYQYLMSGNANQYGLYGQVIDIREVRPGDIVHVDYESDGVMDHTIVITHVENMEGSNSYSDILFSGHTSDRKNQPLSDMGYKASYRALRIYGMVSEQIQSDYWIYRDGVWCYYRVQDADVVRDGWKCINSQWYYFDAAGARQTGWKEVDGSWYYLRSDGTMKTGWLYKDNQYFYLREDGSMATGFLEYRKQIYYLQEDGIMVTGEIVIGNEKYLFSEDGDWIQ